ncbi:recombinase family protein [Paenibacillus polymyxa]|uniref:recombinase family protein n=1 Tax=Paenibacillus polymyxa TaxID=1406 RepID=UPI0025B68D2D|nr:recombinase family protein [Paenibacillus polymyxa]MDN4080090.1 recombinase family protein [Paenibacillus polymyxa]MDN4105088.1 recombinase family protein [Paenibacillus polymyxa]MDN4115411.1 recombinase family protein [Paenibacillus polymyxa]
MNIVIYLRVSSEQQVERELSIPAQREALQRYADERGWSIVDEYIDEAKSAKTDARPDFQRMIAAAQQPDKHFDAIVVHKFDRFSRNRADHAIYKALLKKQGVTVVSASEPVDADTPHGFLLESMLEVISEFYNVNLRHETLKGMRENASQGFHCGGRVPFGYRRVQKGRKVTYELGTHKEVELVQQMFQMAVEGHGGKRIARVLNQQNIIEGKRWAPSTVLAILDNPVYLGKRVWNKKSDADGKLNDASEWIVTENAHPAIVDQQLWYAAQASLMERKINKPQ